MKPKDRLDRLVRYFPLALTGLLTLICLFFLRDLTVEELLHYTPESLPLAAAAFLALYAFKSLSVVFPLSVLYVASGIIFPLWMAWLVNLGGLAVCAAIPYWVGRVSGRELARRVVAAHPKAARIWPAAARFSPPTCSGWWGSSPGTWRASCWGPWGWAGAATWPGRCWGCCRGW